MTLWAFESNFIGNAVGIDEVGYGPWAGPVVAAAVWINYAAFPNDLATMIKDSKALSPKKRASIDQSLRQLSHDIFCFGIGEASADEIDQINVRNATHMAMERAYGALNLAANHILVDGNHGPKGWKGKLTTVIQGDKVSRLIAAASIIAKVYRDNIMENLHQMYPHYGWDGNKGYGTAAHLEGLQKFGVTPYHRKSYRPIQELLVFEAR